MDKEERKINIEDGDQQDDGLNKEEEKQENETAADAENTTEEGEKAEETAEEETDPLDKALEEIKELKEQLLYKAAEFDNFRRRTIKEKAVQAVLPVADDMERALENSEKTDDPQVLKEGMELIYQKFMKALESLGVKKIDTTDADFDVDFHEAIAMVPGMGDEKSGKVLDCVQTGYTLNDKVIRHAKVAVGQR